LLSLTLPTTIEPRRSGVLGNLTGRSFKSIEDNVDAGPNIRIPILKLRHSLLRYPFRWR
jgi:hypothetical protein